MFRKDSLADIDKRRKQWEEGTLKKSLERFGAKKSPNRFYTPLDVPAHDFLNDVGFPGQYPFTAAEAPVAMEESGFKKPKIYAGYGIPEDTRDYYKSMLATGRGESPHMAFDLPTQCGYDSDAPIAWGEVGKTGVAVNSLRDFEIIYEAYQGEHDLDKIYSSWVINAPANIILAMYVAIGEKRGILPSRLACVPQNDILKEYVSRGTYIFPPQPSMRLVRDTITYCTRNMPLASPVMISGAHIREAGSTAPQVLAFTFANGIAYAQLGIDAGLGIDDFAPNLTFLHLGGSMEMFQEIALQRAGRRMWAKIMRERFGAKDPESWVSRVFRGAIIGNSTTTAQRPLNNLTRTIVGGVASALSGGGGEVHPAYDEPLGLGYSLEGRQLMRDAERIIRYEAKLCDVIDPLAGSYYVEGLTDKIESEAWQILGRIDAMGGAVASIESGWMGREIARSAYEYQKKLETGEEVRVGVNQFLGPHELEVMPTRLVPHPYDPAKREDAERRQIANTAKLKRERDNSEVARTLRRLREAALDERVNILPPILEAVKAYATLGEMCDVMRQVFGEYTAFDRA
ncbi:MAG: methylmalonyl-CoA mutase [Chloroflexi bacterium]|nr:methylmalonyl-CoA mutase [Chloroflexota bacterium]